MHGGRAAFRPQCAQLRHPGIHAPHGRYGPRLSPPLHIRTRSDAPGDAPGLGVDIDEELAAKFPYERAYLPINRKLDGTMHIGSAARGFRMAPLFVPEPDEWITRIACAPNVAGQQEHANQQRATQYERQRIVDAHAVEHAAVFSGNK